MQTIKFNSLSGEFDYSGMCDIKLQETIKILVMLLEKATGVSRFKFFDPMPLLCPFRVKIKSLMLGILLEWHPEHKNEIKSLFADDPDFSKFYYFYRYYIVKNNSNSVLKGMYPLYCEISNEISKLCGNKNNVIIPRITENLFTEKIISVEEYKKLSFEISNNEFMIPGAQLLTESYESVVSLRTIIVNNQHLFTSRPLTDSWEDRNKNPISFQYFGKVFGMNYSCISTSIKNHKIKSLSKIYLAMQNDFIECSKNYLKLAS